ncbi:FAD-dependent oxidoreductase [Alloyangia pacifica]|uniref:FAD-dependent oxidoreductase n=1 Tax=Alloyangia pacifica TaxID=311180 RepID=UPI001CFE0DE9|nr:FAD-dependent oxidoreductase [Alloyangia pacifica]
MTVPEAQALPDRADLVVLGSGAAGLSAALTAALEGLTCVVLEHAPTIGGTSARSSGTVWVPGNAFSGGDADLVEARRYLNALVGDKAPAELRETFLENARRMLDDLGQRVGLEFRPLATSQDYRPDVPGAAPGSRALEPLPFDGRELGERFSTLAEPLKELMLFGQVMVSRSEATRLLKADRSIEGAALGLHLLGRAATDRMRGYRRGTRLVMGNALVARLYRACLDAGVMFRTGIEIQRLPVSAGRVTAATLDGGQEILATRGVVLAGGGFPASARMRAEQMPEPVPEHTPAAPGCDGSTLTLGLEAGGRLGPSSIDNALWFPSSIFPRAVGDRVPYPHIVLDRAKPGSIVVGRNGRRFANEALPYHYFVRAMYRADTNGQAIPAFMICDRRFISRYGFGAIRPRTPSLGRYIRSGYLISAPDARSLARQLDLPPDQLARTLGQVNADAVTGKDSAFGRGESPYDRALGDPEHGPNPCFGAIGAGPLYALRLEPTPLGTSRGLVTDTDARVLGAAGDPIPGLYACGNDMHSPFGGEYPGAGAQLGLALTFGWRAARHAAGIDT